MTILAAVDGEQVPSEVVTVAYELSKRMDDELIVIHVMLQDVFDEIWEATSESSPSFSLAPGISYGSSSVQRPKSGASGKTQFSIEEAQTKAETVARNVVNETLEDWHNVRFVGRVGKPVEEILDEADRSDAQYVVIGGRRRSPVGKAVFGSITQSILLNADLPVMTVLHDDN